jgi:hypothetical protein
MSNPFITAHPTFEAYFRQVLSPKASILLNPPSAVRWSDHEDILPGVIVVAGTEQDVQTTVRINPNARVGII